MSEQPTSSADTIRGELGNIFSTPERVDPNIIDLYEEGDAATGWLHQSAEVEHDAITGLRDTVHETFQRPETDAERVTRIAGYTRVIPAHRRHELEMQNAA